MILDSFNLKPEDCVDSYQQKKHWFARLIEAFK